MCSSDLLDPPPSDCAARWRIVSRRHTLRILDRERGWQPVRDPRLDAAAWREGAPDAYVLLERADEP